MEKVGDFERERKSVRLSKVFNLPRIFDQPYSFDHVPSTILDGISFDMQRNAGTNIRYLADPCMAYFHNRLI